MKKALYLGLLILPLLTVGCAKSPITIPNSPFPGDNYTRIGMNTEYNYSLSSLDVEEAGKLRSYISKLSDNDANVSSYVRKKESRNLEYAYFGNEISTISMCSLVSETKTVTSYSNEVEVEDVPVQVKRQTSNGIIVDNTENISYIHSDTEGVATNYHETIEMHFNDQTKKVVQSAQMTDGVTSTYYAKLSNDISSNFFEEFTLLGKNAVYGKNDTNYVIREAYSEFVDFNTDLGRKYKSSLNYYYEALLGKDNSDKFFIKKFRFYFETLILSESINDNVAIIYLDYPVLVDYSEITYNVSYDTKTTFNRSNIPSPTV